MKLKVKITLAFLVVIIISIIAAGVHFSKIYFDTEKGKTRIYANELGDTIKLEGNKEIIQISKMDINKDDVEDYIVLLGEPKYEEVDTTKVKIFKALSENLEMYNNVSIEYVNGKDDTTNRYDTKTTYGKDIKLSLYNNVEQKYVLVYDTNGNVALMYLNEEKLENVISNTFGDKEFVGYTIEGKFNENDGVKLELTLDNYGKDYLAKKDETYIIDYTDTQVNSENYRLTYMANKYSNFEIVQSEDKTKTYLICTQYLLYSNVEDLNKNEGFIKSKFEIKDDKKIEFNSVEVVR